MNIAESVGPAKGHRPALKLVKTHDLGREEWLTVRRTGRQNDGRRKAAGYDQVALDAAGSQGFGNGAFEDSDEEIPEILEEFFPATGDNTDIHCPSNAEADV